MTRAAGLALALLCLPLAVHAAPMKAIAFPQEMTSEFKTDPATRYGRLPNGMTYMLQKNTTPPGTATIYMRVGAGSMMETPEQKGLAHFIEHMAFEGTTNIPNGELKRILERHGFAFGADANAFTTDSKTFYQLFAPKSDDKTLDTALFIMREIAGNMTIAPADVDRERGVILGEERLRDNPISHRSDKWNHQIYAGQKYADYALAIGSVDIIKNAPSSRLKAFYDSWYRPELTTLIVVGDFDVDAMEARIKAKFADWTPKTAMPETPDWGAYQPKDLQTFSYSEKGIDEELGVTWLRPADDAPDSLARDTTKLQDAMLQTLLSRRLQAVSLSNNSYFLSAGVNIYDTFKASRAVGLSITPKHGFTKLAFEQAYDVFKTFHDQGVTADEAALIQTILPVIEKNMTDGHRTRGNANIANDLMSAIDNNSVDRSLEDSIREIDTLKPQLSQDALNARLKTWFDGDGPVLSHSGEDVSGFDEAAMKADFIALNGQTMQAYKAAAQKAWSYTDFSTGEDTTPTHSVDADFGYGHYIYPNGVVLNIKPTTFAANQVSVEIDFAGGMLRLDPKSPTPPFLTGLGFLIQGGLKDLTLNEIQNALVSKSWSINYLMASDKTILSGGTLTGDLPTELQLLRAFTTDAAYRPDSYKAYKAAVGPWIKNWKTSPDGVLNYYWGGIINSGDPRFDQTALERIDQIPYDAIHKLYMDSFRNTPITITIVGDVNEATTVAEVGKTFGTLPPVPKQVKLFPGADHIDFPPKTHNVTLYHQGRADQSISMAVWPTLDFYSDVKAARGLNMLAAIVRSRLYDDLRETQGADYAPNAYSNTDDVFKGYGLFGIRSAIKAGGDSAFRASVARIVADLKAHPVGEDELLRAKTPVLEAMDNELNTNGYWAGTIARVGTDPRARATQLNRRAGYEAITAADLMALAQTYLRDDTLIHVQVLPDVPKLPPLSTLTTPVPSPPTKP